MLLKLLRSFLQPGPARLNRRALEIRQQGDLQGAGQVLRDAARRYPRDAATAVNLALVLLEQNQAAAGAAELERALALEPDNGAAHYNFANLLRNAGRHAEALDHFRRAARATPAVALARQELMFALLDRCDWDEAQREADALREQCRRAAPGWMDAVAPLTANYLQLDPAACKQLASWHAAAAARNIAAVAHTRSAVAGNRLRIGYLSQDFREHPVGHLMRAGLPLHDRSGFEVFAYSYGHDDGGETRRAIAAGVEHFVDIASLSDAQAAEKIAADGVQVLIDLAGHTTGGRLGIPARRPAPVQAHYLGYAGTTGAVFLDYFISDPIATPVEMANQFTEQLALVPGCFMMSAGVMNGASQPPSRAAQGLPENAMVYSSFTNAARITRDVFAGWMQILQAVPGGVLWLRQSDAQVVQNLRAQAQRCGVDPVRLLFAPRVADKAEHMARLALADLSLDTIGWHSGHSTTNELLCAGVPVLTATGATFASRVGVSLVTAAGLPELVARDAAEYIEFAISLGRDRARCVALKEKLKANRNHALLFDPRRVVAGLESVYAEMWRQHQSGQPPRLIEAGQAR